MPTAKTAIIEEIFRSRWDESARTLAESAVTLEDVVQAIQRHNSAQPGSPMSLKNPANFFKDFIRNMVSANINWPTFVLGCGYTARQVTARGLCFQFVQLPPGQGEAFPQSVFRPKDDTVVHRIESVSMPMASRRMGRNDEPWLVQVVTRLRIVETHFSLYSKRKVRQVDLLQMSVKLQGTEIDAMFLLIEEAADGTLREAIVTCEAKRGRDDILEDQVLRQAKAPFTMRPKLDQDIVVPIAIKCLAPSKLYVVEFNQLDKATYEQSDGLTVSSESIYEINPPVPGICG